MNSVVGCGVWQARAFFPHFHTFYKWIQFHSSCQAYNFVINIVSTARFLWLFCLCEMQIENKKGTCTFKLACFLFLSLTSHIHTELRARQLRLICLPGISFSRWFAKRKWENENKSSSDCKLSLVLNVGRAGKLIYFHVIFLHIAGRLFSSSCTMLSFSLFTLALHIA